MKSFLEQVEEISKQDIRKCYQCSKCTSGCPVASFMDIPPHRINKYIILGNRDIMKSNSAWICTACYTCGTRCPNDIDTSEVFDAVKLIVEAEKIKVRDKKIKIFHRIFMNNIEKYGRIFEMGMIMKLKLKTMDFFSDVISGTKLFLKGKIGLTPHKIKDETAWMKFLNGSKGK